MTTRVLAPTQTTDLAMSLVARDSSIAAPVDGTTAMMFMHEAAMASDFASMSAFDALVVTLKVRHLVIKLTPILTGGASPSTIATGAMSLP